MSHVSRAWWAALTACVTVFAGVLTSGGNALASTPSCTPISSDVLPASPAIAATASDWELAYVGQNASSGCLLTAQPSGAVQVHHLGLQQGTTPAIAAVSGGYQLAFQSNRNDLWTTGPYGTKNLHLGMMAGTSPSIASVPGGYQIAFEANTGLLYTTGRYGTHNLGLGMAHYGSPSIAAVTGGYVTAFKANTGAVWLAGTQGHHSLGQMMNTDANESPSIAAHGSTWEIAFMALSNDIWTITDTTEVDTGHESADLTSPAAAWTGPGGWAVTFVTDDVPSHPALIQGSAAYSVDAHAGVASNTSIAIGSNSDGAVVRAYISSSAPAVVVGTQYFGIP